MACFLAVKFKVASLPANTSRRHIIGAGLLAGIGFTMSIFIASLAFKNPVRVDVAKISALLGSFLSIAFAMIWIHFFANH